MKNPEPTVFPIRPAWLEINLSPLRRSLAIIREDMQRYNKTV